MNSQKLRSKVSVWSQLHFPMSKNDKRHRAVKLSFSAVLCNAWIGRSNAWIGRSTDSPVAVGGVAPLQSNRIDRVSDHCMCWCVHRAFRWWTSSFGSQTRTRLDSHLCVDDGFFSSSVEIGHAVLDLFSPCPTRSPPCKYA